MVKFLILFFSLLLVAGAGTSGLLNLGDSLFPFFPQESFGRLLHFWDSHVTLGREMSAAIPQLPWYGLAALLDKLGLPLWLINRLWFVLPFLLLGLAMYFLSGIVFGREKNVPRLIATLFFLFNPFTVNLAAGSNILTLSFASGVFVFGLFVRGLGREKLDFRDVILFGMASVFAATSFPILVLIILLCAAYFLFFMLINRRRRSRLHHAALYSLFLILYSLLVNAWWLLPFIYQVLHPGYFQTLFAAGTDVGTLKFISEHTSLFEVSRLFYGYQPSYFFPISNYYHYLLAPTVMMILVVLIFMVSLFRKKSKFEIFFLALAWVSVILASGTRPPFGFVYQFLWDHIPYFHIFRTTNRFNLWTMVSYPILLGFLYQHLRRSRLAHYSLFFILTSILLSAWPLLSGNIYGQLQPHQIPNDYHQLRDFLQQQPGDFRVMSLPMISWLAAYSWSAPFDMQEILLDFSPQDTIVNMPGYYDDLLQRELSDNDPLYAAAYYYLSRNSADLAAMYSEGETPSPERVAYYQELAAREAVEALRLMGVRYLVVHRDYVVIYHGFPRVDISVLLKNIKDNKDLGYVMPFGDLDVYEVKDIRPRIYTTTGEVAYQKITPTEYKISVAGAAEPYKLVFSENFNRGWRLDGAGPEGSLARGFGNVWQIDKTGDDEMHLYYRPQKLLEIGFLVSGLSLVGGLGVLFLKKR